MTTDADPGPSSSEEPAVAADEVPRVPDREEEAPSADSLGGYVKVWWGTVRAGELGVLPIVFGLVVIATVFGLLNDTFYTERNFTNLLLQMAPVATMAIGIVFVLLIAEIDLSVAFVSGVGGVLMTLFAQEGNAAWPEALSDWPWWLAIIAAVIATTIIGLLHALIITKAGVPSFVVTLAGLLIWSGMVLVLTTQFSTAGTIRISDPAIVGIANEFLPDVWGWVVGAAIVGSFAVVQFQTALSRRARNLEAKPTIMIALQLAGLAIVTFGAVWYANQDRGVPVVSLILGAFIAFWSFVASRLRFGRHVYAVGGNAEAARRAGINVDRVRMAVFMINGFMAGVGGIILASRLRSVATNTGGGNLLLNVIAAAVIGGASLFGGRGRVVAALLGALVIASIDNGMNLLGLASGTKFVITGLVLLGAVLIDALAKRRRAARGVV